METDVLIIGAGLSGLSAAYTIASEGISVVLLDRDDEIGGKLNVQVEKFTSLPGDFNDKTGREIVSRLKNKLRGLPVTYLLNSEIIGTYKNGSIAIQQENEIKSIQAKRIIVATGAAEKPIAFQGWTNPGVMTVGAIQKLINKDFVLPGRKIAIYELNSFALEVAIQLYHLNVEVVIITKDDKLNLDKYLVEKINTLDIPIIYQTKIKSVRGNHSVEKMIVENIGTNELTEIEIDVLCVDGGLHPITEVCSSLKCELAYNEKLGGWIPKYDTRLNTSNNRVYVAGNAAGITCHGSIYLTGIIAGTNVVTDLGKITSDKLLTVNKKYWMSLYDVESAWDMDTWQERRTFIGNFIDLPLTENPHNWNFD